MHPDDINPNVSYQVVAHNGVVMVKDIQTDLRITLNRAKREVVVDYPNHSFMAAILPVGDFMNNEGYALKQTPDDLDKRQARILLPEGVDANHAFSLLMGAFMGGRVVDHSVLGLLQETLAREAGRIPRTPPGHPGGGS
jgi:hypothetical protein